MYFIKLFGSGLGSNVSDPRLKTFAMFHCALCGRNTDVDITRTKDNFNCNEERRCPYCGQLNSEDKAKNLKAQLEKITSDKSRIEIEIDQIERELNELKGASNGIPSDSNSAKSFSGKNQESKC